jgi:hypothetical protein
LKGGHGAHEENEEHEEEKGRNEEEMVIYYFFQPLSLFVLFSSLHTRSLPRAKSRGVFPEVK